MKHYLDFESMGYHQKMEAVEGFAKELYSCLRDHPALKNSEIRRETTLIDSADYEGNGGPFPDGAYDTHYHVWTQLKDKDTGMLNSFSLYSVREEDGKQYFEISSYIESQTEGILTQRMETLILVPPGAGYKDLIPRIVNILDQHHVALLWSSEQSTNS